MLESDRNLRMGLLTASVVVAISAFAAAASAHDPSPYQGGAYAPYQNTYQDPRAAHVDVEQGHIADEQHHAGHDQLQRDEALRHGDFIGAWSQQQHINQERHHLGHEQEHVDHEQ